MLVSLRKDNEIIDKYLLIIHFSSKSIVRGTKKEDNLSIVFSSPPSLGGARTAESRHRGSAAVATCGGAEIHDRGNPPLIRVR